MRRRTNSSVDQIEHGGITPTPVERVTTTAAVARDCSKGCPSCRPEAYPEAVAAALRTSGGLDVPMEDYTGAARARPCLRGAVFRARGDLPALAVSTAASSHSGGPDVRQLEPNRTGCAESMVSGGLMTPFWRPVREHRGSSGMVAGSLSCPEDAEHTHVFSGPAHESVMARHLAGLELDLCVHAHDLRRYPVDPCRASSVRPRSLARHIQGLSPGAIRSNSARHP